METKSDVRTKIEEWFDARAEDMRGRATQAGRFPGYHLIKLSSVSLRFVRVISSCMAARGSLPS
jgi:hypothetical protein